MFVEYAFVLFWVFIPLISASDALRFPPGWHVCLTMQSGNDVNFDHLFDIPSTSGETHKNDSWEI